MPSCHECGADAVTPVFVGRAHITRRCTECKHLWHEETAAPAPARDNPGIRKGGYTWRKAS